MAKLLAIQIEIAQGGDDSELATEEKKVANNTAADADAAGEASTSVDFDGPVEA